MKTSKIEILHIELSTENPRYEPVENQEKAIETIFDDQKEKLFYLAKDILQWGLNPHDPIMVYPSPRKKKKYVILEGNRRLVALKALIAPNIIDDQKHPSLKKKIEKLHKENKKRLIKSTNCFVYKDPKEAEHWIALKHGYGKKGVGTEGWSPLQKDRWKEKTEEKTSRVLQIIKKMKVSKYVPSNVKNNLNDVDSSNLDRLISDPDVREFFGLEMTEGIIYSRIDEEEVMKGLVQLIKNILDPNFIVRQIYTKEERKSFLKKFPKNSRPNKKKKSKKSWRFSTSSKIKLPSVKSRPKKRNTLIPKSFNLKIKIQKIDNIYDELKKLNIEKFSNAGAVLFRVFIELSIKKYIEENKLSLGKDLQQQIIGVASHLENKKWANKNVCKGIKMNVKNKNHILGIDTWQAYVHNPYFSPAPDDLIRTWDNLDIFIKKVWEHI